MRWRATTLQSTRFKQALCLIASTKEIDTPVSMVDRQKLSYLPRSTAEQSVHLFNHRVVEGQEILNILAKVGTTSAADIYNEFTTFEGHLLHRFVVKSFPALRHDWRQVHAMRVWQPVTKEAVKMRRSGMCISLEVQSRMSELRARHTDPNVVGYTVKSTTRNTNLSRERLVSDFWISSLIWRSNEESRSIYSCEVFSNLEQSSVTESRPREWLLLMDRVLLNDSRLFVRIKDGQCS